ncbi:DMT family transporter [Bordetella sp. LUAb4]|uniref:DMT family transporter n=1 Tax=Bordetella sp. LUAb4 TaxID=2843195 RepID=UPI001E5A5D75|nr:DMT family transporter [Bordetella sp. LUAb4]
MPKSPPALTARLLPWAALLLPPLFWAGNFIAGRAMRDAMTPMTLALGRWLLYVGLFPSVGAYLLYTRAVQHFGPERAGLVCSNLGPAPRAARRLPGRRESGNT